MKVKLTHVFTERERQAVALAVGTKKLATRTQVVGWIAALVAEHKAYLNQQLQRRELNSDPCQKEIPGVLD